MIYGEFVFQMIQLSRIFTLLNLHQPCSWYPVIFLFNLKMSLYPEKLIYQNDNRAFIFLLSILEMQETFQIETRGGLDLISLLFLLKLVYSNQQNQLHVFARIFLHQQQNYRNWFKIGPTNIIFLVLSDPETNCGEIQFFVYSI